MKRIISVLLSAGLLAGLLAGCGGESGGKADVPMGRYMEEQGETLEGMARVYGFQKTAAGDIVFYGRTLENGAAAYYRYVQPAAGGAMEKTAQDWLGDFVGEGSLRDVSEAADGTVYLLYSPDGASTAVARRAPGGAPEQLDVAELGGGGADVSAKSGGVDVPITVNPDGSITAGEPDGEDAEPSDDPAAGGGAVVSGGAAGFTATPKEDTGVSLSDGGSFTFNGGGGGMMFASGLTALDDGFLLLFGTGGAYHYTSDGVKKGEYPGTAYSGNVAVHGNTLLTLSTDGGELWSYDLDAARQTGSYTYDNLGFGTRIGMDAAGLFLADSGGIYRQASGGAIWERLVDGGLTTLVMPNVTINGLSADGGDGFYALLNVGEDSYQLMHYVYDPSTPTDPDTELTIFALKDNATIRQAIGEFQRVNPNVRVNFRIAMDDGAAATAEDVIRSLNTEILGGKGPDILLLDGLPVDSYIEKNVLLDLTELVNAQVAGQGLLSNLMNAYSRDGKVYGVPSKFTVPVMMGAAGEVDNLRTLVELAGRTEQGISEQPPFLRAPETLWDEQGPGMLIAYYDALSGSFLKDGAIDQQALEDYFAAMLRIDGAVKQYTPQTGGTSAMISVSVSSGGGFEKLDMGASDLKNGLAQFHVTELSGLFGLRNVSENLSSLGGQKLESFLGGNRYTPVGGVGVLASGKQQELSKSFVELLLSPTVQDSYVYDGYPVNGASLDKLIGDTLEGADDMGFLALCRGLDTPVLADQVVKEAVLAQTKGLLDGSVTPAQAAANAAEKTQLYLAE